MESFIMTISVSETVSIILRTVLIFLYAFLLLRILGRRKLSHIGYTDLLLIIAFGSAVGDVMIYNDSVANFWASMIALTIVSIIVKVLDEISSHSKIGNKLLEGDATLIIDGGEIVKGVLERENLTEARVLSWLRLKNVSSIESVAKAFIEPDGEVSVILKDKEI